MNQNYYSLLTMSLDLNKEELFSISNNIKNNKLIIKYNYIPESLNNIPSQLYFNKDFNWSIDFQENTNMAMLHLHSLHPIKYLLLSYNIHKDNDLLKKSLNILFSWNNNAIKNPNFYTWYTHCVADRALIIAILLLELKDSNYKMENILKLQNILKQHHEFLLDKDNYKDLNHGTMIDRSLLLSSIVLEDKKHIDFSINRLKRNFQKTFTEDMVCVENSVTYSIFNLELFISIEKYILNKLEQTLHSDFDMLVNKSLDFLDDIKMPDEAFPHYGDGEKVSLESLRCSIIYNHYDKHQLFADYTRDNEITTHFYKNEGFIIFKNRNKYFLCNCGSLKINHKHADDGSIIYFNDGEVFIDSGIYSYDNNTLRDYFKSTNAHNSLILNNESYDYAKSNLNNGYIDQFKENEHYFYFQLVNKHYEYAHIIRHIFILKEFFHILIHDQIISPIYNLNSQIFNLSPAIKDIDMTKNLSNTIILNNKTHLSFDNNTSFNIKSNEGKYAEKFHSLLNIPKLELTKNGSNQTITTLIHDLAQRLIELNINHLEFNKIILEYNKCEYTLDFEPIKDTLSINNYIHINNLANRYFWKVYSNNYKQEEYAFYIYKDDNRYDILWYSEDNKVEYVFHEPGTYFIRCFIRNKNNHEEKVAFRCAQKIQI